METEPRTCRSSSSAGSDSAVVSLVLAALLAYQIASPRRLGDGAVCVPAWQRAVLYAAAIALTVLTWAPSGSGVVLTTHDWLRCFIAAPTTVAPPVEPLKVLAGVVLGELGSFLIGDFRHNPQAFESTAVEDSYTALRFSVAGLPTITFLGAGAVLQVLMLATSPKFSAPIFVLTALLALMSGFRASLLQAPDQRHACTLFGRMMLGQAATMVVCINLLAAGERIPGVSWFEQSFIVTCWSLHPLYMRLSALQRGHRLGFMATAFLGESFKALTYKSYLGPLTEMATLGGGFFIAELLGFPMEKQLRASFLKRFHDPDALAPTTAATAATAQREHRPKNGESTRTPEEAAPEADFDDTALEAYEDSRFTASGPPYTAMSYFTAAILACNLLRTDITGRLGIGGAIFFSMAAGTIRSALLRMQDQHRARLLFGRSLLLLELCSFAAVVGMIRGGQSEKFDAFDLGMIAIFWFLHSLYVRLSAVHPAHRILFQANAVLIEIGHRFFPWAHPVLGIWFDAYILLASMLVGDLFGFTSEYIRRKEHQLHVALLTSKRAAEERARRASAEVEEVAGRVQHDLISYLFHELRNDANALVGSLDMLCSSATARPESFTSAEQELIFDGQAHASHAAQVITNLLDWVKLRAGQLKLPVDVPFELDSLGNDCVRLVKHLVHSKPVEVTTEMPRASLGGAPIHLKQVLINLLTNASKYTSEGTISLTACIVEPQDPRVGNPADTATIRFAVEDTGCGVPEACRATIFNEFISSGFKMGTGLGLPLCSQLVSLMGGCLELSVPSNGRGSCFAFTISCMRRSPSPAASAPTAAETPTLASGLRVLVADDLRPNRTVLVSYLRRAMPAWQLEFTHAETGEEALELLTGGAFDLAFLDENYRTKSGPEALTGSMVSTRIRELEKLAKPMRHPGLVIIGVTGDQMDTAQRLPGQDATWGKPTPKPAEMAPQLVTLLRDAGHAL